MEDSPEIAEGTIVVNEWIKCIIESSHPFLTEQDSVLVLPHLSDMIIFLAERIIEKSCPGISCFVLGSNISKRLLICDENLLRRKLLEESSDSLGVTDILEAELTVGNNDEENVVLCNEAEFQNDKCSPLSAYHESSNSAFSPGTVRLKKPDRQFYIPVPKRKAKTVVKAKRKTADPKEYAGPDTSKELLHTQPPADDNWEPLEKCLLVELFSVVREVKILKPDRGIDSAKIIALEDTSLVHILEAYDFPTSFEDRDIRLAFQNVHSYNIKWINDTSALLLFRDVNAAAHALTFVQSQIKVRPMSLASPAARVKVKKASEFVLPYKERPKTLPTVARRMISSSLGLRTPKIDSEELILIKAKAQKKSMQLHPVET